MHPYVHRNSIYNSRVLETAWVSISKRVDGKNCCLFTQCNTSIRKKELLSFATAWMELESIMLNEISQEVRDKYRMISPLTGTWSTKWTSKQNITKDTEIENRLTVIRGERGGIFRGKGWRVYRNNYKGHVDNNRGVEMGGRCGGLEGGLGCREKAENCTWTTIKKIK